MSLTRGEILMTSMDLKMRRVAEDDLMFFVFFCS